MAFKKQRMGRKKVCYFTKNKIESIDYKDIELFRKRKNYSKTCNRYTCKISAYAGYCNQACTPDGFTALRKRIISHIHSICRRMEFFHSCIPAQGGTEHC